MKELPCKLQIGDTAIFRTGPDAGAEEISGRVVAVMFTEEAVYYRFLETKRAIIWDEIPQEQIAQI